MDQENIKNPFIEYCGMQVHYEGDGQYYMTVELKPEYMNPYGQVHGGFLFTMIDTTAGYNARKFMIKPVTLDCNVHYYRNVAEGTIRSHAVIVKRGRKVSVVRAQVLSESGRVLAEGEVTYYETGDFENAGK